MTNIAPELPPPGLSPEPEGGAVGPVQSGWRLALQEFMKNRLAVLGVIILVFFVLLCFVGPLIYRTNQSSTNLAAADLPPGPGYPLGADDLGFNEL
ncbi:MAG TPA: hypothetical protein VEG33_05825, partial [Streptosporangiaceae bacterium]|nr:hypothetical protein [Streptosporangiaceae bacterium]